MEGRPQRYGGTLRAAVDPRLGGGDNREPFLRRSLTAAGDPVKRDLTTRPATLVTLRRCRRCRRHGPVPSRAPRSSCNWRFSGCRACPRPGYLVVLSGTRPPPGGSGRVLEAFERAPRSGRRACTRDAGRRLGRSGPPCFRRSRPKVTHYPHGDRVALHVTCPDRATPMHRYYRGLRVF